MNETKQPPTPCRAGIYIDGRPGHISLYEGEYGQAPIGHVYGNKTVATARAERIVHAVNNHDAIVRALLGMLADQGEHSVGCKEFAPGYDDSRCCPVHAARAALRECGE